MRPFFFFTPACAFAQNLHKYPLYLPFLGLIYPFCRLSWLDACLPLFSPVQAGLPVPRRRDGLCTNLHKLPSLHWQGKAFSFKCIHKTFCVYCVNCVYCRCDGIKKGVKFNPITACNMKRLFLLAFLLPLFTIGQDSLLYKSLPVIDGRVTCL